MDRKYASGAAGSPPSPPASPSSGYPTAGNPGSGTPATKQGPYWYHMIMEELMAIVTAGGITPDQSSLNQVYSALQALFPAFADQTGLLGSSGYLVIPLKIAGVKQKVIVQWGSGTSLTSGVNTNTFPIAFPSACWVVVGSAQNVTTYADVFELSGNPSTASFTSACVSSGAGGTSVQVATTYRWIAIGY